MDSRRFGDITITLPMLENADGSYLNTVSTLDTTRGSIEDFAYIGERLRDLDLTSTRLLGQGLIKFPGRRGCW